ncbi:MAG: aldo/keto reductase [Burkholderiales bacterium]|nr:aldo/keto reductase [Burkholderiales bacterium]OJX06714.1 MAG: aldo/keto reductase [Burkholderiales bacterium 70-64]
MQYVNLGTSGLKVSRIALGMMTFGTPEWRPWVRDEATAREVVRRAIELGVNVFDTADLYSAGLSEEITGRLVREFARRDEVVVATKVFYPVDIAFKGGRSTSPAPAPRPNLGGLSRKHILAAADASLRRLGTDYIDLYQLHRFDPATPVEETMAALDDLVRAGKVRYLGASSMWAWQFAKMQRAAERSGGAKFVSMQNHYNLAYREEEREMIPYCRDSGVGIIPWSPLARGFLAGNRKPEDRQGGGDSRARTDDLAQQYYYRSEDFEVVQSLSERAAALGVSNATLAYAWLLQRPGVTAPIVGASKPWQVEEAVKALDLVLGPDDVKALEAPYRPHFIVGHA